MAGTSENDDRPMSEILASIRKIVTDEEETRRSAADERRRQETETGAEVFVLTSDMRTGDDGGEDTEADEAPLELTTQDRSDTPLELSSEQRTDQSDSDDVLELTTDDRAEAPLELAESDRAEPQTPLAALAPKSSAPAASTVDFTPAPGLTENEVEKIVRRVLREELQGPIGQQISRKVKAMIRDEVAKSLLEEESLL